ncbi:MAG: hypothetical protein ACE15D_02905 [Candidatus Eisenbacteria bacterium]
MNGTLITAFLRQRLHSRVRMALAIFFFATKPLIAAIAPRIGFDPFDWAFALIVGAGMIGQDVASGVLAGILARPVRRSEYVLSRGAATAIGAGLLCLAHCAAGFAALALRGAPVDLAMAASRTAAALFTVIGASAVLLFFSSAMNALGDLAVYLIAFLLTQVVQTVGSMQSIGWLQRTGLELGGFVQPILYPAQIAGPAASPFAVVSYLSTITLCIVLAILLTNRKELSYAAS